MIPGPEERGELFSAYLDGELTRDEVAIVGDALEGDEVAVDEYRALREVRIRIRLMPEMEVPAYLLPDGHLGDRLSAYLDGELVTIEQRRVTKHLESCPACRAELQELDRARTAVRSLPGMGNVTAEMPVAAVGKRHRVGLIAGTVGAAAAAAVLVLGLSTGGRDQPAVTLEDLAVRHVARASAEPAFSIMPAVLEVSGP
jgi:anti-sigma factor RsiW